MCWAVFFDCTGAIIGWDNTPAVSMQMEIKTRTTVSDWKIKYVIRTLVVASKLEKSTLVNFVGTWLHFM
jgi:hypothetical protein